VRSRPDILVLGSGGVLGEAWLTGVLAGIEDGAGFEFSRCEYFVGTSAGAIVAARLAAGVALQRPPADNADGAPPRMPDAPPAAVRPPGPVALAGNVLAWGAALSSPLIALGMSIGTPGGALVRSAVLRAMPRPDGGIESIAGDVDALVARFDGRLRITAVARRSGRRVVFGRPGAPAATVGEAVGASCAVPWLLRPVRIDGVEYVDGGVWSPTNLDAAPAGRGARILCLSPTAGLTRSDLLVGAASRGSRAVTAVEASIVRGRGARVTVVVPDQQSAAAIGRNLMDRSRRPGVFARAYAQGRELGHRPAGENGHPRRRGRQATAPGTSVTAR
jgi:NTE family protein